MTEDRFNDFDLEVRSLMENAREEVPSRVWDSISGSLDRIETRRKTVSLWWKRTAAGIAAAAAIAAGVFFTGTPHNSNIQHITEGKTIAETVQDPQNNTVQQEEPFRIVEAPKGGKSLVAQTLPESDSKPVKTFKAEGPEAKIPAPAENVSSMEKDVAPSTTPEKQGSPAGTDIQGDVRKQTGISDAGEADPFAAMEFQDSRRRKAGKVSLTAGSNFESNSLDASGISVRRRFLPAIGPMKTSVTELSESTYGIPLTFGLGVRFPVSPRVSIGTGLQYSMLSRSFRGIYTPFENGIPGPVVTSDINNYQHYIGIPLNVYCNLVNGQSVMLYVFGGGTLEKGLTDSYTIRHEPSNIHWSRSVKGVQVSAAIGLGVEFRLAKGFGLYIDPALRYYFDCNQPESIRTRQNLMMNLDLGLRFDIGR